jgi:hypothetical protein
MLSNYNTTWENTGSLGSLLMGEISELYIKTNTTSSLDIIYQQTGGSLPPGISLLRDGSLSGYVTTTSNLISTSTYIFTATVTKPVGNAISTGTFSIIVNKNTSTNYTSVHCKPYLTLDQRSQFYNFIDDKKIFLPELIYRPFDPHFGIQREMRLYIHYGIEKISLSQFASTFNQNFYKRRFLLGEVKSAVAKVNNAAVYEIVYVDVLDYNLTQDRISIPRNITIINDNIYPHYPSSIINMRIQLEANANFTGDLNPKFMNTFQTGAVNELGFIAHIPLCYTLPGKAGVILRKISQSDIQFNLIDFHIDRMFVTDGQSLGKDQYLIINQQPIAS